MLKTKNFEVKMFKIFFFNLSCILSTIFLTYLKWQILYIISHLMFYQVLQYNVPSGKKNRALTLVYAYKQLASQDQLTEENIRLARILGWCNEMVRTNKFQKSYY